MISTERLTGAAPLVAIVMGSRSDWPTLRAAAAVLEQLGVPADARVMLVGGGHGGSTAVELATRTGAFVVDQVVTAGAPSALVPRVPDHVRVLSLEDRDDPVVQLGSLVNHGTANRLTVVFERVGADTPTA